MKPLKSYIVTLKSYINKNALSPLYKRVRDVFLKGYIKVVQSFKNLCSTQYTLYMYINNNISLFNIFNVTNVTLLLTLDITTIRGYDI